MSDKPRILIADGDPIVADSLAELLADDGHDTATANDSSEVLALISDETKSNGSKTHAPIGIVIADMNLPRKGGLELLRDLRRKFPAIVPIMITGFGKIEDAVEVVRAGALDYLTKPIVDDELRLAVSKAINQHALLHENQTLKSQLSERYGLGNLVGADYRMQKVYDLIEAVAESRTTVLISGESGTGKSMVARAVHTMSPRKSGPFITFACGAIPETLLESELFGHVKGAFTGADADKPGKIAAAEGGTLFIDEINSATPALQLKLLRVLQERAYEPVGSTQTRKADVRFVLATNQSLASLVEEGMFREDLYYRINVVNIQVPALRDRPGDVALLAEHFLAKYCAEMKRERRLNDETIDTLRAYTWPGNVRELENAIERAVLLSRSIAIEPKHLPEHIVRGESLTGAGTDATSGNNGEGVVAIPALRDGWTPTALVDAMLEPEKQIILAALEANDWNRQETAKQLNINRTTLYKKIKQFGLDEPA